MLLDCTWYLCGHFLILSHDLVLTSELLRVWHSFFCHTDYTRDFFTHQSLFFMVRIIGYFEFLSLVTVFIINLYEFFIECKLAFSPFTSIYGQLFEFPIHTSCWHLSKYGKKSLSSGNILPYTCCWLLHIYLWHNTFQLWCRVLPLVIYQYQ